MKVKNILDFFYIFIIIIFIASCFSQVYFTLVFYSEFLKSLFLALMVLFSLIYLFLNFFSNKFLVNKGFLFIFFFIAIVITSLILQFLFLPNKMDKDGVYALNHALTTGLSGIAWVLVGVALSLKSRVISESNFFGYMLIFISILILYPFLIVGGVDYWELSQNTNGFKITHLTVSIYVVMALLFANAFIKNNQIIVFLMSTIILLILGGMSDVVLFFISFFIYWFLFSKNKMISLFYSLIFIFSLVFIVYSYLWGSVDFSVLSRLINLSQDESFKARLLLIEKSLYNLPDQFLFGNPNLLLFENIEYSELYNTIGANFHNIFGFWQYYGFFSWFLCVIYIVYTLKKILKYKDDVDVIDKFGILLFIFTTLSILLTKSMTFYAFWMCLGFWGVRFSNKSMVYRKV